MCNHSYFEFVFDFFFLKRWLKSCNTPRKRWCVAAAGLTSGWWLKTSRQVWRMRIKMEFLLQTTLQAFKQQRWLTLFSSTHTETQIFTSFRHVVTGLDLEFRFQTFNFFIAKHFLAQKVIWDYHTLIFINKNMVSKSKMIHRRVSFAWLKTQFCSLFSLLFKLDLFRKTMRDLGLWKETFSFSSYSKNLCRIKRDAVNENQLCAFFCINKNFCFSPC